MRVLLLIGLTLAMTGCGFALRGSQPAMTAMPTVTIVAAQPGSALTSLLEQNLEAAGVTLQPRDQGNTGDLLLQLGTEETESRTLALTSRVSAAQYELTSSTSFTLSQNGSVLAGPETISVQRTYFEDIANIAGSSGEEGLLREEMRQELINRLLRRLEAILTQ